MPQNEASASQNDYESAPFPISVLGKKDGALSKKELAKLLCHPSKGVELRKVTRENRKVWYFKGVRLYESFRNKQGQLIDTKNAKQVTEYGQWLLDEKYIVPNKRLDKNKRIIARNKAKNPTFTADGMYTWTQFADFLNSEHPGSEQHNDLASATMQQRAVDKHRSKAKKTVLPQGVNESDENNSSGISWLHIGILLMILAPSIFAIIGYFYDMMITPKQKLMNFYARHAPEKNNDKHIDKLLRKYAGKESQLFDKLEKKYERIKLREEAKKKDEN